MLSNTKQCTNGSHVTKVDLTRSGAKVAYGGLKDPTLLRHTEEGRGRTRARMSEGRSQASRAADLQAYLICPGRGGTIAKRHCVVACRAGKSVSA